MSADSPIGNWTGNAGSNPADLFGSRLTRVLPNRISKLGGMSGGRERTSGTVCCSSLSIGIAVCSITQSIRVHSIINFKAQGCWLKRLPKFGGFSAHFNDKVLEVLNLYYMVLLKEIL